jgi:hypothetical protein
MERSSGPVSYEIRHLPVSSFPELPAYVSEMLDEMHCLIPQTYEAHRPENVIHGNFEMPSSSDWAVLCSMDGTVSLDVFFASTPGKYMQLASFSETERLQLNPGTKVLGFNWGIDPATPESVHQAQVGMKPRPARLEHDAVADSEIDHNTSYHYYAGGMWILVDMP